MTDKFRGVILMLLYLCSYNAGNPTGSRSSSQQSSSPTYTQLVPPEKLKEDLDFLFKTIEEVHPNMYAYVSQEEFKQLKEQLYERISRPIKSLNFYKVVAPVVASLRSGHT